MILKELKIERIQGKVGNRGDYAFGVKINDKEFIYLLTNFEKKYDQEVWENNFSHGYLMQINGRKNKSYSQLQEFMSSIRIGKKRKNVHSQEQVRHIKN